MSGEPVNHGEYVRMMLMALSKVGWKPFNNPVGIAQTKAGNTIKYGLCKGSSDIIGWLPVEMPMECWVFNDGPMMIAVFCGIECKLMKHDRVRKEQKHFIDVLNEDGGFGIVCRAKTLRPTQQHCDEQAEGLLQLCQSKFA